MKNIALFLLIALFAVSCEKEAIEPVKKELTPEIVLKMYKENPASVSDDMVQDILYNMMARLQLTAGITFHTKGLDTTFNTVFQVLYSGVVPSPYAVIRRIQTRILIDNQTQTPDLHSMSFVLQGSSGIIFPAGGSSIELYDATDSLAYAAFVPFPQGYILHNAITNRFFFVFFSLTPLTMDWVDKIVLQMSVQAAPTGNWITVDRSQSWYFAMSADGITDYDVLFWPDTLRFN